MYSKDQLQDWAYEYYKIGKYKLGDLNAQQRKETMEQNTEVLDSPKLTDEQLAKLLELSPEVFVSTDEADGAGTEEDAEGVPVDPATVI